MTAEKNTYLQILRLSSISVGLATFHSTNRLPGR